MNSIHNNGKGEKSLDQDLEALDLKYQRVESDEPPEMLDQAILNRAHRAVEAKNGWLDFGWIHGLTTVGLLVLTFSVVVSLRETGQFDPTVSPVSDKALRSQNRKNASQAAGELKAKKDLNADATYQLDEKAAAPTSEGMSRKIRLEKQRQAPLEQSFSDDASAGQPASPKAQAAPFVSQPPTPTIPAAPPAAATADSRILAEPDTSNRAYLEEQLLEEVITDKIVVERPAVGEATAEESVIQAKKESNTPARDRASESNAPTNSGLEKTTETDKPASVAEAEADLSDLDTLSDLDFAQQTELLDIIMKHKMEGNENWKTELDVFIQTYPDYPLPDVLEP